MTNSSNATIMYQVYKKIIWQNSYLSTVVLNKKKPCWLGLLIKMLKKEIQNTKISLFIVALFG